MCIRDRVQPGGHHFATEHTLARYQTAFYPTLLSTRENFESWEEQGAQDTASRANTIWKQLLEEYEQPEMNESILTALNEYVDVRKKEIAQK